MTEHENEVIKDFFHQWKFRMKDSNIYRMANRIGKNLAYPAFRAAWVHGQLQVLKEIINKQYINKYDIYEDIQRKIDALQEEAIQHEKI